MVLFNLLKMAEAKKETTEVSEAEELVQKFLEKLRTDFENSLTFFLFTSHKTWILSNEGEMYIIATIFQPFKPSSKPLKQKAPDLIDLKVVAGHPSLFEMLQKAFQEESGLRIAMGNHVDEIHLVAEEFQGERYVEIKKGKIILSEKEKVNRRLDKKVVLAMRQVKAFVKKPLVAL